LMLDDLTIGKLICGIYADGSAPPVQWDHFNDGDSDDRPYICWGIKTIQSWDVVVFRGSVTVLDWLRDLMAWVNPSMHDALGPVHPGFMEGMDETWKSIKPLIKNTP